MFLPWGTKLSFCQEVFSITEENTLEWYWIEFLWGGLGIQFAEIKMC